MSLKNQVTPTGIDPGTVIYLSYPLDSYEKHPLKFDLKPVKYLLRVECQLLNIPKSHVRYMQSAKSCSRHWSR
jgi:hypothetical protein